MLNHIVIMGRMVRDPELRRTGSGIAVAGFSVAVERDFPSKEGGEKETVFLTVLRGDRPASSLASISARAA